MKIVPSKRQVPQPIKVLVGIGNGEKKKRCINTEHLDILNK